jgi:hypothetical protein
MDIKKDYEFRQPTSKSTTNEVSFCPDQQHFEILVKHDDAFYIYNITNNITLKWEAKGIASVCYSVSIFFQSYKDRQMEDLSTLD